MIAAVLFGIAIGNIVIDFRIGSDMEYQGAVLNPLNP